MHGRQCIRLCQRSFVLAGFCEALAPEHRSGVCVPLHFAELFHAAA